MRINMFALICSTAMLASCAQVRTTWIRTDGQRMSGNPALMQQGEVDQTICRGEMQKANMSGVTFHGGGLAGVVADIERGQAAGDVAKGCMAQRGYILVREDEAEARLAAAAAAAATATRTVQTTARR